MAAFFCTTALNADRSTSAKDALHVASLCDTKFMGFVIHPPKNINGTKSLTWHLGLLLCRANSTFVYLGFIWAYPHDMIYFITFFQFVDVSLSDYRGKYVVLFFYPLDFTFVCPTEIIAFSERAAEFR